jgi:hypothetical protein
MPTVPQTQPALVLKNMVFVDKIAFPDTRFWKPAALKAIVAGLRALRQL